MSKKKKVHKTNAIRQVEQQHISYSTRTYTFDDEYVDAKHVAQLLGIDPHSIYKTIVTVGDATGPIVAVLPGDCDIDLKQLAKVSHNKRVSMLPMKELEALTGYIRGGCSPIGMKKQFPTYISEEAQYLDQVTISAGQRGLQLILAPADLCQLTQAVYAPFVKK